MFDIEEESDDDLLQDSSKTEKTNEDGVKVIPTLVSQYTYINDQLRKTERRPSRLSYSQSRFR